MHKMGAFPQWMLELVIIYCFFQGLTDLARKGHKRKWSVEAMQIHKKLIKAGRRSFLRNSAIAGGAVVAGSQVARAAEPEAPVIVAEPTNQQGYSKTEHVSAYYKRARF